MHLLSAEVTAFTKALKQRENPLALGRQTLPPAVQGAAERLGLQLRGWRD
jgi:hypothetical protein